MIILPLGHGVYEVLEIQALDKDVGQGTKEEKQCT